MEYYNKLEDPTDEENDMLDLAFGLTETQVHEISGRIFLAFGPQSRLKFIFAMFVGLVWAVKSLQAPNLMEFVQLFLLPPETLLSMAMYQNHTRDDRMVLEELVGDVTCVIPVLQLLYFYWPKAPVGCYLLYFFVVTPIIMLAAKFTHSCLSYKYYLQNLFN